MGARDVLGLLCLCFASAAGGGEAAALDAAAADSIARRGAVQTRSAAPPDSVAPVTSLPDTSFRDGAAGAPARAPADTVIHFPEVRVEDIRPHTAARRLPTAFVTELRPEASPRAAELLPEILRQVPGVHVQQYGGLGAFSVMSLRGGSPGQVALFLDGTPLTSAAHSVVSLADLPATAVERIEVYRGASPLGLGPAGATGAVNLVTARDARPPEAGVMRGSFDTWEARGSARAARATLAGYAHLGYQGSDGDFTYHDDNGTWFNLEDDSVEPRRNNRFDSWTAVGGLSWQARRDLRVGLRADGFVKRQGVPGLGANPTRHAALAFGRALTQLEAAAAPRRPWPRATLRAGAVRERSRFRDPYAELGMGTHDTDDRLRSDHLDLELEWAAWGQRLEVQAGGAVRGEEARLHDALDGFADPPASQRRALGALLALRLRPLGERLVLHAAERRDWTRDALRWLATAGIPRTGDVGRTIRTPQLGARLAAFGGLELRANWTRAERPPDFLELFGNQGSVLGNPALLPERIESWDAGLSWALGPGAPLVAALTWAHFESRARDLVLYVRSSPSSVRALNVGAARVGGDELGLRLAVSGLALSGAFTWQDARDASDVPYYRGRRLPQRPGREGWARLGWRRGLLSLGLDVHALGDNYLDRYNSYRVASRTLAGAWLTVAPPRWPIELVLEGKNLGDRQAADVAGFPLPGRSAFVTCASRFGRTLP